MWPFKKTQTDPRSGRLVFLIECLLNQNARNPGAAESPAVTPELVKLLIDADVGMVQIPCPEMACLGFRRGRSPGQSIREALQTPTTLACCRQQAADTADRIRHYAEQGFEVLAVLGGNRQSPACAVHCSADSTHRLADRSGIFMLALAEELERRNLRIPFRGMRDIDAELLAEDLCWLKRHL